MNQPMPTYVSRFDLIRSTATENFVARGIVITGPNEGQYVTAKGDTEAEVREKFLVTARMVYNNVRRRE